MRPKKRGCDDRTRSSNENKRSCVGAGGTTELGDLDSEQDVWSGLSEELAHCLSKSFVSLALSDGHKVLFASSGIAIYRRDGAAKFLTSASLVRALDKAKCLDNVKIEVRHEGDVVTGFLDEYDLDCEIAVVKITSLLDVRRVSLRRASKFVLNSDVVAMGRHISGKLKTTNGKLTSNPSRSENSESIITILS